MKSIAEVLSIFETTREPNFEDLAKIINNIILHQSKNSLKPQKMICPPLKEHRLGVGGGKRGDKIEDKL